MGIIFKFSKLFIYKAGNLQISLIPSGPLFFGKVFLLLEHSFSLFFLCQSYSQNNTISFIDDQIERTLETKLVVPFDCMCVCICFSCWSDYVCLFVPACVSPRVRVCAYIYLGIISRLKFHLFKKNDIFHQRRVTTVLKHG